MITYAPDNTPDFDIGTVATHTCNVGFALVGEVGTRTCFEDDSQDIPGVWSGSAPTCERKNFNFGLSVMTGSNNCCWNFVLNSNNTLILD